MALVMMIKIIDLHDYKEKVTTLEDTVSRESGFKSALFNMTKVFAEFNCTQDTLVRLVIYEKDADVSKYSSYTDFLHTTSEKFMHEDDLEKSKNAEPANIISLLESGTSEISYEYRTPIYNEDPDSPPSFIWHRLLLQSKYDHNTNDVHAFFLIYEIQNEKEIQFSLQDKAERDALTGGYNKQAAQMYISSHLQEKQQGTFFMIDLDNFKAINDNLGHTFGDEVICTVFNEIKSHFRSNDITARIGGDEFIVFAYDRFSKESLEKKATEICKGLKKTYTSDEGTSITISSSIGISHAPENGVHYEDLFNAADKAMYISKNSGKNSYTIC